MPDAQPPDEPPAAWWKRDVERRLEEQREDQAELAARMTANEKSLGAEMNTNIRRDEQMNGEFGLIATMRANTAATAANTAAIIRRDEKDAARDAERATYLRRIAVGLVISLILILVTALASGTIHIS